MNSLKMQELHEHHWSMEPTWLLKKNRFKSIAGSLQSKMLVIIEDRKMTQLYNSSHITAVVLKAIYGKHLCKAIDLIEKLTRSGQNGRSWKWVSPG